MKQILFVILVVFATVLQANAQDTKKKNDAALIASDTAQMIRDIDKLRAEIKADTGNYEKVVLDADANGYRWHFFKGKELKFVQLKNIGESTEADVEWYFNNNLLIYSEQNLVSVDTHRLIQNSKMYLQNEIMFAWISSVKGKIDPSSDEFHEASDGLKDYAKELRELYIKSH